MLRRASDRAPSCCDKRQRFRLTRRKLERCGLADHDLLAVLFFDGLIDREDANVAQDGFAGCSPLIPASRLPRGVRITSTRSFGRMKPPAPVSGEIWVEMARMPDGRIAAMKPEPLAFTSFASRIGSPATKGARTIMPLRFSTAFGRSVLRMKLPLAVVAGQACQKTSAGVTTWPREMSDFATRISTVSNFGTSTLGAGGGIRPASQHGGNATCCYSDSQHNDACGFHTLTLTMTWRQLGREKSQRRRCGRLHGFHQLKVKVWLRSGI